MIIDQPTQEVAKKFFANRTEKNFNDYYKAFLSTVQKAATVVFARNKLKQEEIVSIVFSKMWENTKFVYDDTKSHKSYLAKLTVNFSKIHFNKDRAMANGLITESDLDNIDNYDEVRELKKKKKDKIGILDKDGNQIIIKEPRPTTIVGKLIKDFIIKKLGRWNGVWNDFIYDKDKQKITVKYYDVVVKQYPLSNLQETLEYKISNNGIYNISENTNLVEEIAGSSARYKQEVSFTGLLGSDVDSGQEHNVNAIDSLFHKSSETIYDGGIEAFEENYSLLNNNNKYQVIVNTINDICNDKDSDSLKNPNLIIEALTRGASNTIAKDSRVRIKGKPLSKGKKKKITGNQQYAGKTGTVIDIIDEKNLIDDVYEKHYKVKIGSDTVEFHESDLELVTDYESLAKKYNLNSTGAIKSRVFRIKSKISEIIDEIENSDRPSEIKDGTIRELFKETSNVKAVINLKNGLYDGLCKRFHPNGVLSVECTYKDGERHGLYKTYDTDANIASLGTYHMGYKHGVWKTYINGKLNTIQEYEYDKLQYLEIYDGEGELSSNIIDNKIVVGYKFEKEKISTSR